MHSQEKIFNKDVFLWALYDFANTPLTVAMGGLFLAQWVVLDNGIDDIWYGLVFTLSTILLLLTSPFWGAWSDQAGKRIPFLKWSTYALIAVGLLLGFVTTTPGTKAVRVIAALILFFFIQYFYQVSLIFYNALLKTLSKPETMGRVSGIGEVFGELGWLVGPAMLLPFSMGIITLWGQAGRGQVFIPATMVLVLLGLPMIFWLKETPALVARARVTIGAVYKETVKGFISLVRNNKNVTLFLISFMFISDALLTANLYFAIYLDQIFKITDFQKFLVLGIMEIVGTICAFGIGKMSDAQGLKKWLIVSCVNLTLIYFLISFTSSLPVIYFLSALVGFGYGGFYVTSRAMLIKISPPSRIGEYFGLYSTFQKFASIIGPVTWGAVTLLLKNYGVFRYRAAILSLSLLMFIGTLIAFWVQESRADVRDAT